MGGAWNDRSGLWLEEKRWAWESSGDSLIDVAGNGVMESKEDEESSGRGE